MTRLATFWWTWLACIAAMTSICLVSLAYFLSSAFAGLVSNPWFLAFYAAFLVLYMGGGIGFILGFASLLEKKASRDAWGRRARSIALYGSPIGIPVFFLRLARSKSVRPAP